MTSPRGGIAQLEWEEDKMGSGLLRVGPELAARIRGFLARCEATPSPYEENFPAHFAQYVLIYDNYMSGEIVGAICRAAKSVGQSELIFIAKEWPAKKNGNRIAPVDSVEDLQRHIFSGCEFYLAALDFTWLAWAFHEPCLHIGGDAKFIKAFKVEYPKWEEESSPYYEPNGIPECTTCGRWWRPGWGDWRAQNWRCPHCLGASVPKWRGTDNRTVGLKYVLRKLNPGSRSGKGKG
jgi:hypothetical protein